MKLIVEMEMPKDLAVIVTILPDGRIIKHLGYKDKKQIGKIVGALPDEHGDLVDKETAKNAFDSSFLTFRMKDGETMRGFYQRTIDELPVLIAAERKDDD